MGGQVSSENETIENLEDAWVLDHLAFGTPDPNGNDDDDDETESSSSWIVADFRVPFHYRGLELNVEFFGDAKDGSCNTNTDIVLYIPGVCESAETWTVQNLAKLCRSRHWNLAVLEPQGHGLSEGSMPHNWTQLKDQCVEFCHHALHIHRLQNQPKSSQNDQATTTTTTTTTKITRFVVAGSSMGGVLAAYASQELMAKPPDGSEFVGGLLLSPAVGVTPEAIPPASIVAALSVAARLLPSLAIRGVTPTEDPSHYRCPPWTTRNFEGSWPLGISKLLLDVTSRMVPEDVRHKNLHFVANTSNPRFLVVSGTKDPVVPIRCVREFVAGLTTEPETSVPIELIEIHKGDHGLLARSIEDPHVGKTPKKATETAIEHVRSFLIDRATVR